MAPLGLEKLLHFARIIISPNDEDAPSQPDVLGIRMNNKVLFQLQPAVEEPLVRLSPRHSVTLEGAARVRAGIPDGAYTFCFAYPVKADWSKISPQVMVDAPPSCKLLLAGGFVYFTLTGEVCGINAVSTLVGVDGVQSRSSIQFSSPLPLSVDAQLQLKKAKRLQTVTLSSLLERGSTHYAWIAPGESLKGLNPKDISAGAFAYVFEKGAHRLESALEGLDDEAFAHYFPQRFEGCIFPVCADFA
jgi:hypothetical protein